jgi:hypothetical protein
MTDATNAEIIEVGDIDTEAWNEYAQAQGWSDGLPMIAPTEAKVARFTSAVKADNETFAPISPRQVVPTLRSLAANAVMAGCKPEYFPVVLAGLRAVLDPAYNLHGTLATTHPCGQLMVVSGPIRTALDINCGSNCLGQGRRANATIGRAIRLALVNIGGAIPALGDMSTFGAPSKYSYLAGENEQASPWEPLHVERGLPRDASAVTVIGAECPHNVNDHESITAEGILTTIAGTLIAVGANDVYYHAQPLIVMGPEHAKTVADGGFSKAGAKRFLYEHANLPMGRFSKENIERRLRVTWKERLGAADLDAPVPMVQRPEDLLIAVIGGAGKHSAVIHTFGATKPVTRALTLRDGSFARSVADFCG